MALHRTVTSYRVQDELFESVCVHDGNRNQRGLLMFPNALGVTAACLETAEEIASLGYLVLVVDLYGATVRPTTLEAGSAVARKLRSEPAVLRDRMDAALAKLAAHDLVDPKRLGAFGFCFGGSCALQLARNGADLRGVVSLHGSLATTEPARAETLRARVLVLHGAEDPFVPEADLRALEHELRAAKADWQLVSFGGAYHSFADKGANIPGKAMYDAKVVRRAFRMLDDFFIEACI